MPQKTREITNLKEQGNEAFKANKNQEAFELYSQACLSVPPHFAELMHQQALAVDPDNKPLNSKLFYNRALVLSKVGRVCLQLLCQTETAAAWQKQGSNRRLHGCSGGL